MPARFTNLRPVEVKPVDQLRERHTPLFAAAETSPFLASIVAARLPAAVVPAAARIANPDFALRAAYVQQGGTGSAFPPAMFGGPALVALARLLARADAEALRVEVQRGELMPALAGQIAQAGGQTPVASGTIIQDDLLSLYLVPGAFPDYRRILGFLLKLTRLVKDSGKSLDQLLLPTSGALVDDLHGPWPDNKVPLAWVRVLGRILLPSGVVFGNPLASLPFDGHVGEALAATGLSTIDIRQLGAFAGAGAFTEASASASAIAATGTAAKAKAPARSKARSEPARRARRPGTAAG